MPGKDSKNPEIVKGLYKVRSRKAEIAEGLFLCPFMTKRGTSCQVAQKFRSLKLHCDKMHNKKIALKCTIDNCGWSCVHSIRCLTSHRDNLENHGKLPYKGDFNLDDTCVVVPFVLEDFSGELVDGHFPECVETKKALIRYTGKVKKRAERAAAAEKRKNEKKTSDVKPVKIDVMVFLFSPKIYGYNIL
jgi:hypothetical protein